MAQNKDTNMTYETNLSWLKNIKYEFQKKTEWLAI